MANFVSRAYDSLSRVPGGMAVFSRLVTRAVPYSKTIAPRVVRCGRGYALVEMADKRPVRNHVGSVHAVAVANLGELTTGLAFHYGLPDDTRAILTCLSVDFVKKARGRLVAECRAPVPDDVWTRREYEMEAKVRDQDDEVVALVKATWLVGPQR